MDDLELAKWLTRVVFLGFLGANTFFLKRLVSSVDKMADKLAAEIDERYKLTVKVKEIETRLDDHLEGHRV